MPKRVNFKVPVHQAQSTSTLTVSTLQDWYIATVLLKDYISNLKPEEEISRLEVINT